MAASVVSGNEGDSVFPPPTYASEADAASTTPAFSAEEGRYVYQPYTGNSEGVYVGQNLEIPPNRQYSHMRSRRSRSEGQPSSHVRNSTMTSATAVAGSPLSICAPYSMGSNSTSKQTTSNYQSLSRKSTGPRRPSIKGTFALDPTLHVPATLLEPVVGERKNLNLEVENGTMDVDVVFTESAVTPELQLQHHQRSNASATTVQLRVICSQPKKAFPLIARFQAPRPRRPIHLSMSAVSSPSTTPSDSSNTSPVIVSLPETFRGPLTISIAAGNIDDRVRISRAFKDAAHILSETAFTRRYFIGLLGDFRGETEYSEDLSVDENQWTEDRANISVMAGNVRLQFQGEKEGWFWKTWYSATL